jgi:hypothetical protein
MSKQTVQVKLKNIPSASIAFNPLKYKGMISIGEILKRETNPELERIVIEEHET